MPPILVFDSGVGGLSIFQQLQQRLPAQDYVFACDNAFFPYGTKGEDELVERVHKVLDTLIARYAPQLIVIACNTASTVALPRLRHHYTLPIVGVVPAIKPAAQITTNKCIALLATPGTVQRAYTAQLIKDFAKDCTVHKLGSSELVSMAEDELRGIAHPIASYRQLLLPLLQAKPQPDTVILGCTHFPLLREKLMQAAPEIMHWVDSGEAIARRVEQLLPARGGSAHRRAAITGEDASSAALRLALQSRGFNDIDILNPD